MSSIHDGPLLSTTSPRPRVSSASSAPPDQSSAGPALLLLFIGAFARCPPILLHGRIWAEESIVFLATGWNHPFLQVLLAPHFGYYSVWDNLLAAIATHWLPLQFAALLFSWSAVLILLLTGYFIYRAEFLITRSAKTLGVLTLLFCAPSYEVWINLINSEFYFGIWAAVILLSDPSKLILQRNLALAVAALSGPLTTILAPLFILRALIRRRRGELTQAIVVSTLSLVQIAVAATTSMANRNAQFNPLALGPVLFNKEIVLLFLDRRVAYWNTFLLRDHLHFSTATQVTTLVAFVAAYAILLTVFRKQYAALCLLLVALWLALIEAGLALNGGLSHVQPGTGERYAYTPNLLIEMALLVAATAASVNARRIVARVLLGLAFLSGFADYLAFPLRVKAYYQGAPWRQEVIRWQKDPSTPLHTLPATWPTFHLAPKSRDK